jgi:outer membrane lipoprotein SlyB
MRKTIIAAALASLTLTAVPAMAHDGQRGHRHYRTTDNGIRYWQGNDGRTYCRKPNGTTGLLIGGVAGALLGRTIDTRGDRTAGTVVGAVGGALIGREIERSSARCR